MVLYHAGDMAGAIIQQHKELIINERCLGLDHPDTAHRHHFFVVLFFLLVSFAAVVLCCQNTVDHLTFFILYNLKFEIASFQVLCYTFDNLFKIHWIELAHYAIMLLQLWQYGSLLPWT